MLKQIKTDEAAIVRAHVDGRPLRTAARVLGVSHTSVANWLDGRSAPSEDALARMWSAGGWAQDLAAALYAARGNAPCVCLERIGDNGRCPKHGRF